MGRDPPYENCSVGILSEEWQEIQPRRSSLDLRYRDLASNWFMTPDGKINSSVLWDNQHSRKKRSVIDSLLLLSYLKFGHNAQGGNARLQDINNHIIQALRFSATIVNSTQFDVTENRKAINDLIDSLHTWQTEWEPIVQKLERGADRRDRGLFLLLYGEILLALITELDQQLSQKEAQVNAILEGEMNSDIMSPLTLMSLIQNISSRLPEGVYLPHLHGDDLLALYKNLQLSSIATSDGLLVFITIPLLSTKTEFELYSVKNLPGFFRNTNITAMFQIDTKYFAISKNHAWLMLLDEHDFHTCRSKHRHYCRLHLPLYHASYYKHDCVIEFFLRQGPEHVTCPVKFEVTSKTLAAVYLKAGNWAIGSPSKVVLKVLCHGSPKGTLIVHPTASVIRLNPDCEAISPNFKFSTYYVGQSDLEWDQNYWLYEKFDNFTMFAGMEEKLQLAMVKFPHKLGHLVATSNSFQGLLDNINSAAQENDRLGASIGRKQSWYKYFTFITIGLISLGVACFILYLYCKRRLSRQVLVDTVARRFVAKRSPVSEPTELTLTPTAPVVMSDAETNMSGTDNPALVVE